MINQNHSQEALMSMLKEFSEIPITENDEIEEQFMHFEQALIALKFSNGLMKGLIKK